MSTGAWILLATVGLAAAFGVLRAATDGRFRGTHAIPSGRPRGALGAERVETMQASVLDGTTWSDQLGRRATLLQFSSAFCAPCRTTRHVLADVAARNDGVAHVEIDAEGHLDLVRRLGIMRTPTTLVLDQDGHERTRAAGAPRREQVESALAVL